MRPCIHSSTRQHRRPASKGRPVKYFVVILAIALGVAAIVYGGFDDSPGGQLLGVLLSVGAVVLGVRMVRRSR